MAPCLSKNLPKNTVYYVVFGLTASASWLILRHRKKIARENAKAGTNIQLQKDLEHTKTNVKFLKQFLDIIRVIIPGWTSAEAGYILMVAVILIGRTYCDLWMIHYISATESVLVSLDKKTFTHNLMKLLITFPFFAILNNLLKYATGELKIRMRKNLSLHLYKIYLNKLNYYRLSNLDNRIPNVDHILTVDVDKFCNSLTACYSNISKPLLDIGVFTTKISANVGIIPPVMLLAYMTLSGLLIASLRKPIGRLILNEQKLEGEFRYVNARIATYSEEIAFYCGNMREKETLAATFNKLINHLRKLLQHRGVIGWVERIIGKYFALAVGWSSFAFSLNSSYIFNKLNIIQRAEFYYTNGFLLIKLAQTIGRLVLSVRELTHLVSFTKRIIELQKVLGEVENGKYQRVMTEDLKMLDTKEGKLIIQDNVIKFDKVPIVTPIGDILIKELTVEIYSGRNVLVCGPNGAGKSSIFRILGELWPLLGGELTKPPSGKLFYVPQKPYMSLGTLRDQILYPHSIYETKCTDYQLQHYLELVQLEYLLEREDGLNTVSDWFEILSGGEKQRIAMARLFYHAPQFAILDECTSAVAIDVEDIMYKYCREMCITLLTVSHRKSLWKHHDYVLHLDGRGSYTFNPIIEDMEQFGS